MFVINDKGFVGEYGYLHEKMQKKSEILPRKLAVTLPDHTPISEAQLAMISFSIFSVVLHSPFCCEVAVILYK